MSQKLERFSFLHFSTGRSMGKVEQLSTVLAEAKLLKKPRQPGIPEGQQGMGQLSPMRHYAMPLMTAPVIEHN